MLTSLASESLTDQYQLQPVVLPASLEKALAALPSTESHCAAVTLQLSAVGWDLDPPQRGLSSPSALVRTNGPNLQRFFQARLPATPSGHAFRPRLRTTSSCHARVPRQPSNCCSHLGFRRSRGTVLVRASRKGAKLQPSGFSPRNSFIQLDLESPLS